MSGEEAPEELAGQPVISFATVPDCEAWFAEHRVDVLLDPTVPMPAEPRGEGYDAGHLGGDGDPWIAFTATWDATGFPVAALPAGLGWLQPVIRHGVTPAVLAAATGWLVLVMVRARRENGPNGPGNPAVAEPGATTATASTMSPER